MYRDYDHDKFEEEFDAYTSDVVARGNEYKVHFSMSTNFLGCLIEEYVKTPVAKKAPTRKAPVKKPVEAPVEKSA